MYHSNVMTGLDQISQFKMTGLDQISQFKMTGLDHADFVIDGDTSFVMYKKKRSDGRISRTFTSTFLDFNKR